MQLQPGSLLQGRYRVVGLIAQGGMGAVYRATDERLGSTVALKQTLMADPQLRAAFEREARLLAGLHHPALPVVSDHFAEDGGQFLVMQFIPGDDLAALLRRRGAPFTPAEVLPWATQLLDALDYLHTRTPPIIHRDVKPQNLKLTARGDLALLDFGLAKGDPAGATAASPSLFGYTPQYAPLEQIQGSGTDARSDLYAVGATCYELLTGVPPPDALTRAAAAVRGEADPLRPAHERSPAVPQALADLLGQALALNPALRPPTAAALRDALRAAASPGPQRQPRPAAPAPPLLQPDSAGRTTVAARPRPAPAPPAVAPRRRRQPGWLPFVFAAVLALPLLALTISVANREDRAVVVPTIPPAALDPSAYAGGAGATRAGPLPAGAAVSVPGWEVEVLEQIRGEPAYERLRRANGNNGPPPEGSEYLLLRARVTSTAAEPQHPFGRGDLRVVGERAVAYDGFAAVPPAPVLGDGSGDTAPGATAEGWAAYLVGAEEQTLVAAVGNLITGEARMVALTPGASLVPDPALAELPFDAVGIDAREPAAVGEAATTDDWEVTVIEAHRGDAAWERIYAGNRYNDPPADGMEYVAAYVRVRRLGPGDAPAFISRSYFSASSAGAEVEQQAVVPPDPELTAMLFPGGAAEGWVAVQVPAGAADARLTFLNSSVFFAPESPNTRYFAVE